MKKRYFSKNKVKKFLPYSIPNKKMCEGEVVAVDREIFPLILDIVKSAERSLDLSIFQLNISEDRKCGVPYTLYSYIWNLRERGVIVRVLLNKKFSNIRQLMLNQKSKTVLEKIGAEVKYVGGKCTLHTKLIIVDGVRAYIGSSNLSVTSLCDNYEIGVKLEGELVQEKVLPYFKKLWDIGSV